MKSLLALYGLIVNTSESESGSAPAQSDAAWPVERAADTTTGTK